MTEQKRIFLSVLMISFMGPFMGSSINIAIPTMAEGFGVAAQDLSWVVTAYLLGSVGVLVPFGRLADIVGRRRLYVFGAFADASMTLLAGVMPTPSLLIFFRFLQGVGLAAVFSTSMALLISSHSSRERGRVIGYSASATYIGLSLGPFLGGIITQYFGWRISFFLSAAVIALSGFMAMGIRQDWYGDQTGGMDYAGSFLYGAAGFMTLCGLSAYTLYPAMKWVLAGGLVLMVFFVVQQLHCRTPLVDLSMFRNPLFAMSNLAAVLNYSATFAISFMMSLYLQLLRGFDAVSAGVVMLIQPLVMALLSPMAGSLSDHHAPAVVASAGMMMTTVGLFVFSQLTVDTPLLIVALNFAFIGVGFAFFSSPNSNAVMGAVAPEFYGVASSILSLMRISGQALSMAVVTLLLSLYTLPVVSPDYLDSLLAATRFVFLIFTAVCLAGVGASLVRGRHPGHPDA